MAFHKRIVYPSTFCGNIIQYVVTNKFQYIIYKFIQMFDTQRSIYIALNPSPLDAQCKIVHNFITYPCDTIVLRV